MITPPPSALGLLLASLLLASCGDDGGTDQTSGTQDPEMARQIEAAKVRAQVDLEYESDHRIALLMASTSAHLGHYDRDTGDILGLLLDKLQKGNSEALHFSKEELATMGDLAVPELVRLLNRHFEDTQGNAKVQNCLDVLGRIKTAKAHAPLIKCLDHPRDTVRGATLQALSGGAARPEDFERLEAHVQTERLHLKKEAVAAMFVADPTLASLQVMEWIAADLHGDVWSILPNQLFAGDIEQIAPIALELYLKPGPLVGLALAAAAMHTGDPAPRAYIQGFLESDAQSQRLPALSVLIDAGYLDQAIEAGLTDVNHVNRTVVLTAMVDAIAPGDKPSELTVQHFQAALNDPHEDVRKLALGTLLQWQDPEALVRALAMMNGGRIQMQEVILVIKPALNLHTGVADRVREALLKLEDRDSMKPLTERLSTLQAIGQIPGETSARYLYDLAETSEETLQGLRAHRWLMIQASNTGAEGRTFLATQLEVETDSSRRFDLIWAITAQRDQTSRDFLLGFIQDDREPYELLFAGDRMARLGPAGVAAPVMKRVGLRIKHQRVRAAFDHLMWRWF